MFLRGFIVVVLFCAFNLNAADLTLKDGKVYKNYTVEEANRTGILIFYDGGAATIPLEKLPASFIKAHKDLIKEHFQEQTEGKIQDAIKEKAQETKELNRKLMSTAIYFFGKTMQILDNKSVLAYNNLWQQRQAILDRDRGKGYTTKTITEYLQTCTRQEQKTFQQLLKERQRIEGGATKTARDGAFSEFVTITQRQPRPNSDVIYITGLDTTNMVDDCELKGIIIYRIGRYSYNSTGGNVKNIAKYTADKAEATKFLKEQLAKR